MWINLYNQQMEAVKSQCGLENRGGKEWLKKWQKRKKEKKESIRERWIESAEQHFKLITQIALSDPWKSLYMRPKVLELYSHASQKQLSSAVLF